MNAKKLQQQFIKKLKGHDFLMAIFNSFPDTQIFVKDRKGRNIFVNDLLYQSHGSASAEDLIGKKVFDFCPKNLADKYHKDDQSVIKTGKPIVNREELILHSDGKPHWYSTTKIPLFDNRGNVIGLAGITRNIDRQKTLLETYNRQKRQLKWLSRIDALTGAYNRRYFLNEVEDMFQAHRRGQKGGMAKLSLLMFDLDRFKLINDTYGHAAGDHVLITFCKSARKFTKRKSDVLIRNGGDEFLLCLFGTGARGARQVASNICSQLKKTKWPQKLFPGKKVNATSSVGIASMRQKDSDESLESLLNRADQALYKAKEKGRNRIELS